MEILYDRYAAKGMGLAYYILQDYSLAEDVIIEAFWWEALCFHVPVSRGSFADWFLGFVRQLAAEELPRRETRPELEPANQIGKSERL